MSNPILRTFPSPGKTDDLVDFELGELDALLLRNQHLSEQLTIALEQNQALRARVRDLEAGK